MSKTSDPDPAEIDDIAAKIAEDAHYYAPEQITVFIRLAFRIRDLKAEQVVRPMDEAPTDGTPVRAVRDVTVDTQGDCRSINDDFAGWKLEYDGWMPRPGQERT